MSQSPKDQETPSPSSDASPQPGQLRPSPTHESSSAGSAQGTKESHCPTVPELGTLPFTPSSGKSGRLVRLVSRSQGSDLSIELQPGANKIGRQRVGNHIVLISGDVSRFHAEIVVSDDGIRVRDLGSSNGTFVNGTRVSEQKLEVGDVVAFSQQFSFHIVVEHPKPADGQPDDGPPRDQGPKEQEHITAEFTGGTSAVSKQSSSPPPRAGSRPAAPPARQSLDPRPLTPGHGVSKPPAVERPDEDSSLHHFASSVMAGPPVSEAESPELTMLERERRQLSLLYQVSKRCMSAESLVELDRLLIDVIERIVSFDRGFITYQLPSGDWKLVMSPKGERWDRSAVRSLLQVGLKLKTPLHVPDSTTDERLGAVGPGRPDSRLLLPLRTRTNPVGVIFLLSSREDSFDGPTVDFLSLFADIAALAVANCSRLEPPRS